MAIEHPVTGTVLQWAIQAAGLSVNGLEHELNFKNGSIQQWINQDAKPNQGQLQKVAKALHRPVSFFYLPSPPTGTTVAPEFRKFAGTNKSPGPETVDGMRTATRIQKTATWVRGEAQLAPVIVPRVKKSDDIETAATMLRGWLNWSTAWQTSSDRTDVSVTKQFRAQLEGRGVLVLHLSLDDDLTRGFSLASSVAPLIAINTKDPYRARLFSYAHELVHLANRSTSVCDVHESSDGTETFCNRVAAAILMPKVAFENHVRARLGGKKVSSLDDVSHIRTLFRVSLRAASIRAETLGLATYGLYDLVNRNAEVKNRGGVYVPGNERTKPRIRADEYGSAFINTVQTGVGAGVLKSIQAANLLRLSEREWSDARALVAAGTKAQ